MDDTVAMLADLGVTMPTPAYLAGVLLFSLIGIVAWIAGRRRRNRTVKWLGLALMLYPYLVWTTAPLYAVGIVLTAVTLWAWRQPSR